MQAKKHRTALPDHVKSIPGVIPGKTLETAQRPADGARKLQIVALRVMRLLDLRQQERLALTTNQRDALSLVGAIVHLILGRVVQAANALVSLVTFFNQRGLLQGLLRVVALDVKRVTLSSRRRPSRGLRSRPDSGGRRRQPTRNSSRTDSVPKHCSPKENTAGGEMWLPFDCHRLWPNRHAKLRRVRGANFSGGS